MSTQLKCNNVDIEPTLSKPIYSDGWCWINVGEVTGGNKTTNVTIHISEDGNVIFLVDVDFIIGTDKYNFQKIYFIKDITKAIDVTYENTCYGSDYKAICTINISKSQNNNAVTTTVEVEVL